MNKEQALALAKEHKDKSSSVIVTGDGNVFFASHRNYATHHAKEKNVVMFEFANEDLSQPTQPVEVETKTEEKTFKKRK